MKLSIVFLSCSIVSIVITVAAKNSSTGVVDSVQGSKCGGNLFKSVSVGQSLNYTCKFEPSSLPYWIINKDVYYYSELPKDYSFQIDKENEVYIFVISFAKLWMNNSAFGCGYDNYPSMFIGCLQVTFELNGPENHSYINKQTVFFSCNNHLFYNHTFYVTWNINGILYDILTLPSSVNQTPLGLQVTESQNFQIKLLQCIIYSKLLWKNSYYYSKEVNVSDNIFGSSQKDLFVSTFWTYNFTRILFNKTCERIAWRINHVCGNDVEYKVFLISETLTQNYTTNSTEIIVPPAVRLEDHYIYVIVYTSESCSSYIGTTLKIPANSKTTPHHIFKDGDACIIFNPSVTYIWPKHGPHDTTSCLCPAGSINPITCQCLRETPYLVRRNGQYLCFEHLARTMNDTVLIEVTSDTFPRLPDPNAPAAITTIVGVHRFLIKGIPSSPIVTVNTSGSQLCLIYMNTFSGFSPVTNFSVNVTDETGFFYYFVQPKGDMTTCYLFPEKKRVLERCGNLNIQVRSNNEIGPSEPVTVQVESNYPEICECFKHNVQVDISKNVSRDLLSVQVGIKCKSAYDNIKDATFEILFQNTETAELITGHIYCFQRIKFNSSNLNTNLYNISLIWRTPNSEKCFLQSIPVGKKSTPTTSITGQPPTVHPVTTIDKYKYLYTIVVLVVGGILLVSLFIVLVILIVVCWKYKKLKEKLEEFELKDQDEQILT